MFVSSQAAVCVAGLDARQYELCALPALRRKSQRQDSLRRQLDGFLAALPEPVSVRLCRPRDILRFLVYKDSVGKTIIHKIHCRNFGSRERSGCVCPRRLAASTVDGLVSALGKIFEELGGMGPWNEVAGTGNPAKAPEVSAYKLAIQKEQANSHVVPKQATPIYGSSVRRLASYLQREGRSSASVRAGFTIFRDRAFFLLQACGGFRTADLALVKSQQIRWLQDGSGISLFLTKGKTIKSGAASQTVILRKEEESMCPIKALAEYADFARSHGVILERGFLFRITTGSGSVLPVPVSYGTMYRALQKYSREIGMATCTPHGFRSGCGITLEDQGSADTMAHIGWAHSATKAHYCRGMAFEQRDRAARILRTNFDPSDSAKRVVAEADPSTDVSSAFF